MKSKFVWSLLGFSYCCSAHAASKLELGAGVFMAEIPHYLGSDQSEQYVMPVPYIRYQSDDVEVDRNSFTGYLWSNNNLHLDISAAASIAVDSDDNDTREGMADLDWVLELGPSLNYYFVGSPQAAKQIYIGAFVRKATATDFSSITNAGWHYGPSFYFETPIVDASAYELNFTSAVNVNFADSDYLNYFYGVSDQDSQAERALYRASSGYSGSDVSVGLNFDNTKFWLGGFLKYHLLSDSQQDNSPLVKQNSNLSFGLGFAWKFYTQQGH